MADKSYTIKSLTDDAAISAAPQWEIDEINSGTHPLFKAQGLGSKLGAPGGTGPAAGSTVPRVATSAAQPPQPAPADTTQGMGFLALARAGAGKRVDDILQGISNKAALMNLPKDPVQASAIIDQINARKAEKAKIDAVLMQNPAAVAGNLGFDVATGIAAPARLPAQMATFGGLAALGSPEREISGPLSELAGSGFKGLENAAGTYAGGKLFQGVNRIGNAARGVYTPHGEQAMALSDSAQRLGMPPPSIGELDPNSVMGSVARSELSRPSQVRESGEALKSALSNTVPTAGETLGQPGSRTVVGGEYVNQLKNAVQQWYARAAAKYDAVDAFAAQNGLDNIKPRNTYGQLQTIAQRFTPPGDTHDANPVLNMLLKYDPQAFDWARNMGSNPTPRYVAQTISDGVPISNYHDMRVATNKVWSVLNRQLARDPTSVTTQDMFKQVNGLRGALDSDANAWAAQNSGNSDAMALYNHANDYWKTEVAPRVLDNPVARKLVSRTSPYATGEAALQSTTSSANKPLVDLFAPTLSDQGADMVSVTRGLPDVTKYVATSGETPPLQPGGPLSMLVPMFARTPFRAAGSLLGEMGGLSRAEAAKRLYFAAPPEGAAARLGYGAAQYPAEGAEDWLSRMSATLPTLPSTLSGNQ